MSSEWKTDSDSYNPESNSPESNFSNKTFSWKQLVYRLIGLVLILLIMIPFALNQLHSKEVSDLILIYKQGGPYTATAVLGPFCMWAYICVFIFFMSNIFDCERIAATSLISLLLSGSMGLVFFNFRILFESIFSSRFDLAALFSNHNSQYFLWGSVFGAIVGILIGVFTEIPTLLSSDTESEEESLYTGPG